MRWTSVSIVHVVFYMLIGLRSTGLGVDATDLEVEEGSGESSHRPCVPHTVAANHESGRKGLVLNDEWSGITHQR